MQTFRILHQLWIKATANQVFHCISEPEGLNKWWTETCSGEPIIGSIYTLGFTDPFIWKAKVVTSFPNQEFEFEILDSDPDWYGTRVHFKMKEHDDQSVQLQFSHSGWKDENEHFKISSFCWACYLKIMKDYLEKGIVIDYKNRM